MTTSDSASPRTSTPSQKLWVPRSTETSPVRKRLSSSVRGASPRTRSGKDQRGASQRRFRQGTVTGEEHECPPATGQKDRQARRHEGLGVAGTIRGEMFRQLRGEAAPVAVGGVPPETVAAQVIRPALEQRGAG